MKKTTSNFFSTLNSVDQIVVILSLIFWFGILILPNALRELKIPLFAAIALIAAFRIIIVDRKIVNIWYLGSCVTITYLIVGLSNAYPDSLLQVLFIYIVSPLFWIIICLFLLLKIPIKILIKYLVAFGILGAVTVPLFYYFFLSYGAGSLTWIMSTPNVQYGDGNAAATMHVFGPLMFIVAGCLAVPQIIENRIIKFMSLPIFISAVILSGRAALFVAFFLGMCFFGIFSYVNMKQRASSFIVYILSGLCIAFLILSLSNNLGFDIPNIMHSNWEKISQYGDADRVAQQKSLQQGIFNNYMLGSGHGVGVDVIRSDLYPWRYELLWWATLYRVGLIGSFVYALPVIIIITSYMSLLKKALPSRIRNINNFVFAGFFASLIGSYTNPYYESFEFQWMIFLPLVYFLYIKKYIGAKNNLTSNSGLNAFQ